VFKESAEEIASWEAESTLKEGGEHHILICIWCGEVFAGGRAPLQHFTIQEKVICNELVNLAFIYIGRLEQMLVQGGHGREEDSLRRGIKVSEGVEIAKKMMRNGGGEKSDWGWLLVPFLIAAAVRGMQWFTGLHLKLWIGGHDYPNGTRNLFSSIYDRGK
jgi:hypothetical protein